MAVCWVILRWQQIYIVIQAVHTTLNCSKVSFLQCCQIKRYNKIKIKCEGCTHFCEILYIFGPWYDYITEKCMQLNRLFKRTIHFFGGFTFLNKCAPLNLYHSQKENAIFFSQHHITPSTLSSLQKTVWEKNQSPLNQREMEKSTIFTVTVRNRKISLLRQSFSVLLFSFAYNVSDYIMLCITHN